MSAPEILQLLDAGAAVALAVIVWWELKSARRDLVAEATSTREELTALREGQAVLLDRVS